MTIDQAFFVLALVACLGCGLIAGAFFAFSTFVMKALSRLPANEGIAAMQSINVVVLNPLFLGAFIGTAAACAVAVGTAVVYWHVPGAVWLLVGGVLYLIGTFAVTRAFNIPRNDTLAALQPTDPAAAAYWNQYLSEWTVWNHVRTVAALAAAASFGIALGR
ncbi:membrane protein : Putative integral membrane protein OS=Microcoleus sp. PCC 7113 GN=Mic7113_4396 PE=4 SV=1: DUF1772 [Gemmata massiliana]|uniref:DUF1772 domain-containing protein n=1 Tax=Gemmata massiliana TaxID=1210884 RepID=A0A6P2CUB9_9BACT|nr:anthrone oxygenase family protein [Gemmata massiliana]VTR91976.1 membrane protein : Putative integral membrane protein OS=Microcoleus sp. PCC 7113 GN=Mic7113_4396 PE=4 SV=1: DUF1772 [Gemmata massiliana]